MPDGSDETTPSAGISSPEEIDVAAVFERLKEEVRGRPVRSAGTAPASPSLPARSEAERLWPVSVDRPIERRPGLRGALLRPVKRFLRRLMSWYVGPFAAEQRSFNAAALRVADEVSELVDELRDRLRDEEAARAEGNAELRAALQAEAARLASLEERLERLLEIVEEADQRLIRVERRDRAPGTVAAQPRADAVPDYFAFEARMRGAPDKIRRRQSAYVDDFRDAAPVIDLGCGRGEFLVLLRDAGIEARGVDADADMVAFARGEGLAVEQADVLQALEALGDGSLGGLFAAQLLEHLPPPSLVRLLELAAAKLRPGGLLVAETINPLSPLALRNYFADLTHAQPLVPETLELLARQAGFARTELRFLNPPERTADVPAPVAEILFAPLDYALLARA
jgi:SAM-dependent methyltransferase